MLYHVPQVVQLASAVIVKWPGLFFSCFNLDSYKTISNEILLKLCLEKKWNLYLLNTNKAYLKKKKKKLKLRYNVPQQNIHYYFRKQFNKSDVGV